LQKHGSMKVLRLLVTESIQHMIEYIEGILETKKSDGKDKGSEGKEKDKEKEGKEKDGKRDSYEKYTRVWKLMEALHATRMVDRQQLVSSIFNDHPKEMDTYLAAGIIRYIIKGSSAIQDVGNETAACSIDGIPVRERVFVAAGSPRLRMAFGQILLDPQMQEQCANVTKYLKKQKLKEKEKELSEKHRDVFDDTTKNAEIIAQMVAHSTQWKDVLGAEEFTKRINLLLQNEITTRKMLQAIEEELGQIRAELQ